MADKFRRAKTPRHVRIFHRQMESVAWRHLTGTAVKLLLALARLEKGENNGEFFLSVRKACEITGLSKNAVNRAFHELMDKGFIYCSESGGFSRKTPHAACWGLTWVGGPKGSPHRAPSHAYEKWRPQENRGPRNGDKVVPDFETVGEIRRQECPQIGDSDETKMAEDCEIAAVFKSGTHTSDQPMVLAGTRWHLAWLPESIKLISVVVFWSMLAAELGACSANSAHRRP